MEQIYLSRYANDYFLQLGEK